MYNNAHGSVPMMKFNVMHTATGREMRSFRISGSSSSWYLDTFLSFGVSKNGTDCCSKLVRRACTEPSTLRLGKDMATERCTRHWLRRDAGCCPFRESRRGSTSTSLPRKQTLSLQGVHAHAASAAQPKPRAPAVTMPNTVTNLVPSRQSQLLEQLTSDHQFLIAARRQ